MALTSSHIAPEYAACRTDHFSGHGEIFLFEGSCVVTGIYEGSPAQKRQQKQPLSQKERQSFTVTRIKFNFLLFDDSCLTLGELSWPQEEEEENGTVSIFVSLTILPFLLRSRGHQSSSHSQRFSSPFPGNYHNHRVGDKDNNNKHTQSIHREISCCISMISKIPLPTCNLRDRHSLISSLLVPVTDLTE